MGMTPIRALTENDEARVQSAAFRFCERHGISTSGDNPEFDVEYWLDEQSHPENVAYRRKLWTAVYCRALRMPCDTRVTTAYGYIGHRSA